ncbi:MAG: EAL domain-containing protein, partial [Lachnospiraceae bacterium]|nr:EAL domain-containing protein [Lachnospiraceae bacterium]
VCAVIFYFSLPNPTEFYDDDSPMLNAFAFHELYNRHFEAEDTLYCVAIVLRQTRYVVASATKERKLELEGYFKQEITHHAKDAQVFCFKEGEYLVTVDGKDKEHANNVYRYICYTLEHMKNEKIGGIPLLTTTCPFVCPNDVVSIAGVGVLMDRLIEEAEKRGLEEIMPGSLGMQSEREQRHLIHQMRSALKENRLEIFYQPIYSPKQNKFTSAEALIRMRNEEGGFVSPGVFIPLAEQNGLIVEIGDFVLDEVCRTIKTNRLWEKGIEYIEVNLSVTECIQNDLVDKVRAVLQKYDLKPGFLNLEITETASDSFSNTVDNNIKRLNEYGLTFSLDDFGTGYSSLNRILNLPLSIIKLDMSLVRPAFESDNPNAMTLLKSSIGIAKSVGTEIVAEGVETQEMAQGIIDLGVEHIQGFYYSKPLQKQEFITLLEAQSA